MWMKQVGYKPRSNSMSSATSDDGAGKSSASSQNTSPTTTTSPDNTGKESAPANNVNAGRRRSSAGNYAGLSNLKRNSQDNKIASYMEQKPGGGEGLFAGLWTKYTRN